MTVLWLSLKTTQRYGWRVSPSLGLKLDGVVLAKIRGSSWSHHEWCVEAKQLYVECVVVRCIFQELVHSTLG